MMPEANPKCVRCPRHYRDIADTRHPFTCSCGALFESMFRLYYDGNGEELTTEDIIREFIEAGDPVPDIVDAPRQLSLVA